MTTTHYCSIDLMLNSVACLLYPLNLSPLQIQLMVPQSKKKKKSDWSVLPPKRGQIKAQIFKNIAETVVSTVSMTVEIIGMKVHEGGGGGGGSSSSAAGSAFTTPPPSPTTQKLSDA